MTEKKDREWGSGSYTTHVYAVEARAQFGVIPLEVGKPSPFDGEINPFSSTVLTEHEWKRINVDKRPVGVPNRLFLYPEAERNGLMTYACAMAIACWFQAEHPSAETRLVQIEFSSSFTTKEIGIAPAMNLQEEDRQLYWHLTGKKGGKVRSTPSEEPPSINAVDPSAGIQERGPRA